ncbi:MAG: HDIG domain-containing protein [Clostridiales bacterium]|nr:HDIG domain-containing protein [Clostridiales bacterium]
MNVNKSKKVLPWEAKDFGRTIRWFALHTLLLIIGLGVILLANANFDFSIAWEFIQTQSKLGNFVYLVIALCLVSTAIYLYFYNENRDFILKTKNINLVFIVLEVSIFAMYLIGKYNVYARPFALCSLLILLLVDKRTAVFMTAISSFLMFMIDAFLSVGMTHSHMLYSALIIGFTTSVLAIYLVDGISSRLRVFIMGFVIAVPIIICNICLEFATFLKAPLLLIIGGFTSGMASVVLMSATLPVFEKLFNVVTDYRLSEITDHKSKLISKLIKDANGTFNHSLIVSTLAESCATAIGENPLLARACAYYHDIGKLKQPEFFTENQKGGYNPHNELTPELSTDIIRSHAKDGYDLILKYRLPQEIADVAREHHGTLPIRYFYVKASKFTEQNLSLDNFSYQGPKPQSKIAAIIMIADGCEAKVRTLPDRAHSKVDNAVREIIEERMDFDQFSECELTMKDIDIIRRTITESLADVYHDRVEYPKLKVGMGKYNKENDNK